MLLPYVVTTNSPADPGPNPVSPFQTATSSSSVIKPTNLDSLRQQKAWELAMAPAKNVPMQGERRSGRIVGAKRESLYADVGSPSSSTPTRSTHRRHSPSFAHHSTDRHLPSPDARLGLPLALPSNMPLSSPFLDQPAFMMYMTGGGVQIFSVMSVWFLLKSAVSGMGSVSKGEPLSQHRPSSRMPLD